MLSQASSLYYYSKTRRLTVYILLLIQFFFPVSVSFSAVIQATGHDNTTVNPDMMNTITGIQALMNDKGAESQPSSSFPVPTSETSTLPNLALPNLSVNTPVRLSLPPLHDNTVRQDDILSALPTLGMTDELNENNTSTETKVAQGASQTGQLLSNENKVDASIGYARSLGENLINQQITDWLNQYGKARVQLSTDKTGDMDFLLPLIDKANNLVFSQVGIRSDKERNTTNLGLGYRQYQAGWMWGINSFYDYDITGGNSRVGVGSELWFNYLKFAGNGYFRLTDWHQSPLQAMRDYDERPANGFDIRAEGYLPSYPQLGMQAKYEQYFGDGISLDNSTSVSSLKSNPSRSTLGVSYTPFPLVTFKGDMARGDVADNRIGLELNYRLGMSLDDQMDPDKVDVIRSLVGNRYDFVDRNYNIVMQYSKQQLIVISLPESMTAEAAETRTVKLIVNKAKYGFKSVVWSAPELISAGGMLDSGNTSETVTLTLPAYNWDSTSETTPPPQQYRLSAVAEDNEGNRSNTAVMWINVKPSQEKIESLSLDMSDIKLADDREHYDAIVTLKNEKGEALADKDVFFEVSGFRNNKAVTLEKITGSRNVSRRAVRSADESGAGYLQTVSDSAGEVSIRISSQIAGQGRLKVSMKNGNSKTEDLVFKADTSTAALKPLKLVENNAVANGRAHNVVQAWVADQFDNPIEGMALRASATNDAVPMAPSLITDTQGAAIAQFTNTKSGTSTFTFTLTGTGATKAIDGVFIADISTAVIQSTTVDHNSAVANDNDANTVILTVVDGQGNILPNAPVKIQVPNSAKYTTLPANGMTNAQGQLTVSITNTKAGKSSDYLFEINNHKSTAELIFIADSTTANVSRVVLTDSDITAKVADGSNTFVYTVTVVDAKKNPVEGITIEGSKDKDGVNITVGSETNAQGQTQLTLTSTKKAVSQIMVSARVGTTSVVNADKTVSFIADSEQAQVVGVMLVDSVSGGSGNTKVADGKNTFTFKAEVKDSLTNGNPMVDVPVNWSIEPANAAVVFPSTTQTDAQGFAELTLTSTTTATPNITVSASSTVGETKSVGIGDKVSFIADENNTKPLVVTLIGTEKEKVANGSNEFTFSAKLEDVHGNPVKNQAIVWTKSTGPSLLLPMTTSMTNDMGVSQITLKNRTTTAERNITVTAQYRNLDAVNANEKVSFIADASTAVVSKIALVDGTKTSKIADGKNVFEYTVTVIDGANNPVSGIQVVAEVIEPTGTTLTMNAGEKTGLDGKTVITLNATTTAVSGIKVQAKAGTSLPLKSTQTVNFIANSETAKIGSFELNESEPVEKVANGINVFTYTVKTVDDNGNPLSDQTVTVDSTLPANLKSRIDIQDVGKTNSLGITTVTLKSTITAVNDIQLIATVGRQSGVNANKTVSFIGDEMTANITLNAPILTENAGSLLAVMVTTTDSNTNPVSTDVALSSDPATGVTFYKDTSKTPLVGTAKTNSQGKVTVYVSSTVAQKITVKGTLSSNNRSATLELTFTGDKNSAYVSSLATENAPLAEQVAGVDEVTFIAMVLDQYGNKIDGVPVTYTTTLGGFGANYKRTVTVQSESTGEAKITLKSKLAGIATVSAKTNVATMVAKTDNVTFIADENTAEVIEFTADRTIASVTSYVTLTALIQDANGNLIVKPHKVTLTVSNLDAAELGNGTQYIELTTGTDGKVSTTLTSSASGKATVLAKTAEKPAGMSVDVQFAARTDTARVSSISVSPAEAYAGWEQLDVGATLSAEIVDDHGNFVPDSDVTFVVSDLATAGLVTDKDQEIVGSPVQTVVVKSNAKGIATIVLKSTKSGSATVQAATIKSPNITQSRPVSFTGSPRTAAFHSLSATGTSNPLVAAVDSVTLNAVVWDKNENPVKNTVVSFSSALGTIKDPARVSTNALGEVNATLESTKAGSIDYKGIITLSAQTRSGVISFIANKETAVIQRFTATPDQPVAGSSVPATLSVSVVDGYGNPIEGINVDFTSDLGAFGSVSGGQNEVVSTASNGVASATLTSNNTGTANLTAQIGNQIAKTTSVEFISGTNTPYVSGLTRAGTTAVKVGDRVPFIISTSAKDGNSSKSAGNVSVDLSASAPGTLFYASSTSDDAIERIQTGANGTANVYVLTTRIGTNQITVRSSGTDTNNQVTLNVEENSALWNVVNLDFSPTNAIAGGDDKISVAATVSDTYGNVLTGVDVTFKTTLGILGNGQTEQSVKTILTTDGKSTASVELNSRQSGQATVTATLSNGKSLSGTATFSTASVASLTKASTSDVVVGTTDTLTAKVVDTQGQALKGITVTFTATEGNLGGSGEKQITSTTQNNGEATVSFTHTKAGPFTVTATTGSDTTGKSVDVTFIADSESAHVTSLSSDETSIAGKPLGLTVMIADQYTNAIGAMITLSTTNTAVSFYKDSDAQIPLTSNKVTVNNTGSTTVYMVSEKAESVTITANSTKTTLDTDNSVTFTVIADVNSAKVNTVTLSDSETTSRLANDVDAFEYQASLVDEYDNVVKVGDLNITWSVNNTDVSFKPVSTPANTSKTDKNGVATISLTSSVVASDIVVSAQYKTTAKVDTTSQVKFISDAKTAHVSSVATPDTATTVGTRLAVMVKTTDSAGHPVPYSVSLSSDGDTSVSFYANESDGVAMNAPNVTTDDNGEGTVYVTALHAQTLKVTAITTTTTQDVDNVSEELSFTADSATARVVGITLGQDSQIVGKLVPITINTQDRYTNVVGTSVTLSAAEKNKKVIFYSDEEGKNILPNNSVNTNDQGTATVYVTSEVAENVTVSANSSNKEDDKENSKSVIFIADSGTARVNLVTVLPNIQTVGKYVAVNITTVDKFTNSVGTNVTLSSDSENVKFYQDDKGTTPLTNNMAEIGANGIITVYFTNLKAESVTIIAHSMNSSSDVNNSDEVKFIAGAPNSNNSDLTTSTLRIVANNGANDNGKAAITLEVNDVYGNPVIGIKDSLKFIIENKEGKKASLSPIEEIPETGKYVTVLTGENIGEYKISVELDEKTFGSFNVTINLFGYTFKLGDYNDSMTLNSSQSLPVFATSTDGKEDNISLPQNNGIIESGNEEIIQNSNSLTLVSGEIRGRVSVSAKVNYNEIGSTLTFMISVGDDGDINTPYFGFTKPDNQPEVRHAFTVDKAIFFTCGSRVDGISLSNNESIIGYTGSYAKSVDPDMLLAIRQIEVVKGIFQGASSKYNDSGLLWVAFKDASGEEIFKCGNANNSKDLVKETYDIPQGYSLNALYATGGDKSGYVHGIEFLFVFDN